MSDIVCTCWFCSQGKPHPDAHTMEWYSLGARLLVAESLDPKDQVWVEACSPCGHIRPSGTQAARR